MTPHTTIRPIKALVRAPDPLTRSAISSHLDATPAIEVVSEERPEPADVAVVVADRMTVEVTSLLRRIKNTLRIPIVLIPSEIDRADLFTAVECQVVAVLPRVAATSERIEEAVRTAAAGGGALPAPLLGELLRQIERMQREVLSPHGLHTSGLTPREIDVLRLMSEGLDTAEIADKMCLSERAVKRVIFGVTRRLNLRNRPHAVAYALRSGVI
ncbi:response regulator transcription factor [Streptomyces griseoviridis]|jgi:DNA-binding NarL/FixJ family response regulator|uniref:Helix-turn-helix transcriptional regulator n=3 Tax=Streptomyces TaxID=1883 RepID=A0A918LJV5_STRGD|nr:MULTISPECIES: response regulator transcription factor [Streptomyces]MDP9686191.1 DNA-binding NarL/FixJ family response regulator [Streptomyces griseoviridis]GGS62514.1 helix-turn-helix transcriptional regulator [Streptomyces niveoruber]GGT15203.1 helix-turn-helix transcriptional regulator [Streptomyces griseoviridis]GGU57046.1 helix-turn-helix transcriptional regulator [Streptomyces daghestanicus]GHI35479.1 helix-turn-helix transcriptional regulator [Streptomyces daghestanicus]